MTEYRTTMAHIPNQLARRRNLSVRPLLAFALGLGVAVELCAASADPEVASPRVAAVAADALVRHVLPGADRVPEPSFLLGGRVWSKYLDAGSRTATLQLAIHPDAEGAGRALFRTMPQQPRSFTAGEVEGFLSRRTCHLRYRNLLVLLELDLSEPLLEKLPAFCGLLRDGLNDPAAVRLGQVVDTPRLRLQTVESGEAAESVLVTFSMEGNGDLLIDRMSTARELGGGRSEVLVKKGSGEGEPVLRVARPTGEIAEIALSGMLKRGLKVLPPSLGGPPPLPPAARDAMVAELRSGRLDLQAQTRLMLRLAESPTSELVPFFEETLAAGSESVVKQHAFKGLARALGGAGIDRYRRYAADPKQAEVVRRDAILLIGRYGEPRDRALLDAIAAEGNENFTKPIKHAIAGLEAKAEPRKN